MKELGYNCAEFLPKFFRVGNNGLPAANHIQDNYIPSIAKTDTWAPDDCALGRNNNIEYKNKIIL